MFYLEPLHVFLPRPTVAHKNRVAGYMLVRELRPEIGLRVMKNCFGLDGFDDQTRFDKIDLEKMDVVVKVQEELPWIKAAFGVTALPILKKPITTSMHCIKLLRGIIHVVTEKKYKLVYQTSGVRNWEGSDRKNTSRSIYHIEKTTVVRIRVKSGASTPVETQPTV